MTGTVKNGYEQQTNKPDRGSDECNVKFFLDPNCIVSFFTIVIAVFTGLTWWTYHLILTTSRAIERAYVKMSHKPSGLIIDPEKGQCSVAMEVKNWGNTPTRVTSYLLTCTWLPSKCPLPRTPEYRNKREKLVPVEAFLVKKDSFTFTERFAIDPLDMERFASPIPTHMLYVFGYVDYIDKFGDCHKAGYARQFNFITRTLDFVTTQNYNYDKKECKRSEERRVGKECRL